MHWSDGSSKSGACIEALERQKSSKSGACIETLERWKLKSDLERV
jgi:hypothetical protein